MDISDDALFQAALTLWIARDGHRIGGSRREREQFDLALWEVAHLAQARKPTRKQLKKTALHEEPAPLGER